MIALRDIPARLVVDDPARERPAHLVLLSAGLLLAGTLVLILALVIALA